jgi:hypothetical protein
MRMHAHEEKATSSRAVPQASMPNPPSVYGEVELTMPTGRFGPMLIPCSQHGHTIEIEMMDLIKRVSDARDEGHRSVVI